MRYVLSQRPQALPEPAAGIPLFLRRSAQTGFVCAIYGHADRQQSLTVFPTPCSVRHRPHIRPRAWQPAMRILHTTAKMPPCWRRCSTKREYIIPAVRILHIFGCNAPAVWQAGISLTIYWKRQILLALPGRDSENAEKVFSALLLSQVTN